MKLIILAALATLAYGLPSTQENTAYGYLQKYGIPEAERIRKLEEEYINGVQSKIVGGSPSGIGQFPYQAGLIADIIGLDGRGICGASLVSHNRLVTAAHCWSDGQNQAWRFEVILGSNLLFSGGYRVHTSDVVTHSRWIPLLVRNDIAVIRLRASVPLSNLIAPIALPTGSEVLESFAGEQAIASGFGLKEDGGSILQGQYLSHVELNVLTNEVCAYAFSWIIQDSNICTSGRGGKSTCSGDSGGPLVVMRNGRPILIGITSFGIAFGCEIGFPAAFVRVTSYLDFINQNM